MMKTTAIVEMTLILLLTAIGSSKGYTCNMITLNFIKMIEMTKQSY